MLDELTFWVLHNLDMANSCDFQKHYFSVFKYLCVTKKTVEFFIKKQTERTQSNRL